MRKVRFGVLSTSCFAVEKVIPAMQRGQFTTVASLASRYNERAAETSTRLGIPRCHDSYGALLADPEIDAVYNPLPNHLHVPWSIRALEAGKHVLCEKPIARSAAEVVPLLQASARHPRLKIMEAFMYRHHPQWQKARELVQTGGVGELRTIQTLFSYFNTDPGNIRNMPEIGGGALLDIGCYAVSLSRWLFDAEPQRVMGMAEFDPRFQVDRLTSAMLEFAAGTATFTCSTQLAPAQRVTICGTEGQVEIEIPFNAPNDRPCVLYHQRGGSTGRIEVGTCDQYTIQADLFAQAILTDAPVPTPLEDALRNMEVIDAIFQSAVESAWRAPHRH